MNLFIRPLGRLTSPFGDGSEWRPSIHSGTDFHQGFKKSGYAVADGKVYKILNKDNPDLQQGRAIYTISDTPLGVVEICYYHCWDIGLTGGLAEGDDVVAGTTIYTEGNTGDLVFVGGKKVLESEKPSGKGSHLHFATRWVRRVKKETSGAHYLNKANGGRYRDADGYYYEIVLNNKVNGCFDPVPFMYTPTRLQWISIYAKVVGWIAQLLKKV